MVRPARPEVLRLELVAARLRALGLAPEPKTRRDAQALEGLAGREVYVVEAAGLEGYLVEVWSYVERLEKAPVWVEERP